MNANLSEEAVKTAYHEDLTFADGSIIISVTGPLRDSRGLDTGKIHTQLF